MSAPDTAAKEPAIRDGPSLGRRQQYIRFAISGLRAYNLSMPGKPLEVPAAAARRFVDHMRAFHAEAETFERMREWSR